MNIRPSSVDLLGIQAKALQEGLPYQTLIASILHQYVTGKLTERDAPVATMHATEASRPAKCHHDDAPAHRQR